MGRREEKRREEKRREEKRKKGEEEEKEKGKGNGRGRGRGRGRKAKNEDENENEEEKEKEQERGTEKVGEEGDEKAMVKALKSPKVRKGPLSPSKRVTDPNLTYRYWCKPCDYKTNKTFNWKKHTETVKCQQICQKCDLPREDWYAISLKYDGMPEKKRKYVEITEEQLDAYNKKMEARKRKNDAQLDPMEEEIPIRSEKEDTKEGEKEVDGDEEESLINPPKKAKSNYDTDAPSTLNIVKTDR